MDFHTSLGHGDTTTARNCELQVGGERAREGGGPEGGREDRGQGLGCGLRRRPWSQGPPQLAGPGVHNSRHGPRALCKSGVWSSEGNDGQSKTWRWSCLKGDAPRARLWCSGEQSPACWVEGPACVRRLSPHHRGGNLGVPGAARGAWGAPGEAQTRGPKESRLWWRGRGLIGARCPHPSQSPCLAQSCPGSLRPLGRVPGCPQGPKGNLAAARVAGWQNAWWG